MSKLRKLKQLEVKDHEFHNDILNYKIEIEHCFAILIEFIIGYMVLDIHLCLYIKLILGVIVFYSSKCIYKTYINAYWNR